MEISDDEAAQASGGVDQAATPLPDTANAVVHEFGTWSDGQQLQLVKKLMFKLKHKDLMEVASAIKPILCRDFISNLPSEITEKILSYLSPATLCISEQVCMAWQQIVAGKDNVLWR